MQKLSMTGKDYCEIFIFIYLNIFAHRDDSSIFGVLVAYIRHLLLLIIVRHLYFLNLLIIEEKVVSNIPFDVLKLFQLFLINEVYET